MARAEFEVEIMPDGKLKVITGDLHGPHHLNAEEFMKMLNGIMGEPIEVKSRKGHHHHHHHGDGHSHVHG